MTTLALDVVGIGNAIVDVLTHATDADLDRHGLAKGAMTLIDGETAEHLYAAMGPAVEVSGGSAANTMAGLASLGGAAAFVGKVRNDQLGGIFAHDIRAQGVGFDVAPMTAGAPTARCLIFVTPDAQRTMQTFLGASVELGPEDLSEPLIRSAAVTYLEGYLWDPPRAKEAFVAAADMAHGAGRQVALSLSDPFCVERHRKDFRDLVDGHVDVVFANEHEIAALYETESFADAVETVRGRAAIAVLTRSEKGALVVTADETIEVPARAVAQVIDTTGAGDLFAAGFLHGLTRGRPLGQCAEIGALAAGEVISHFGARPEQSLADLVASAEDLS